MKNRKSQKNIWPGKPRSVNLLCTITVSRLSDTSSRGENNEARLTSRGNTLV